MERSKADVCWVIQVICVTALIRKLIKRPLTSFISTQQQHMWWQRRTGHINNIQCHCSHSLKFLALLKSMLAPNADPFENQIHFQLKDTRNAFYTISYTSAADLTSFEKLMSWFIEKRVTVETYGTVSID